MRKTLLFILILLSTCGYAQVEVAYFDFYACYDASGKDISAGSNEYKLMVTISDLGFGTTLQASTQSKLIGTSGNSNVQMPWVSLVPINQMMQYTGTTSGWHVFQWMSVIVYISTDGRTARIEKHGFNNKYLGYSEYRR